MKLNTYPSPKMEGGELEALFLAGVMRGVVDDLAAAPTGIPGSLLERSNKLAAVLDQAERNLRRAIEVVARDEPMPADPQREREFVLTIIAIMHAAGLKRLPVLQRHLIEANGYTLTRHEDPSLPGQVFTIMSDAP